MRIQGIYAAIATKNIAVAEEFYTKLFERGPDDRPIDGLIQWRDLAGANIQIFRNEKNAGASMATLVVPNMHEARAFLHAAGLALFGEREGDFGKIAKINDPDGNEITLAESPKRASD